MQFRDRGDFLKCDRSRAGDNPAFAERFGTPCYVYFMEDIAARCEALRQAFARRFTISYAVKANPNVALLRRFQAHTDALDISSAGEMQRALRAGWSPQRLSFTGPGKRTEELVAAVTQGIGHIVVESVHEARTVSQIAREGRTYQDILVRLAPRRIPRAFGLNMAGKPSQFGIDEEDLDAALAQRAGDVPAILLAHYPSTIFRLGSHHVSLVLSGHTHGGQIRAPRLGCLWPNDRIPRSFARGLHRVEDRYLHVSAGIGASLPLRVRINCPPELSLLTLKPHPASPGRRNNSQRLTL